MKYLPPFILLSALLVLLWYELFHSKPHELPSALLGEPIPAFQLPKLTSPLTDTFTQKELTGHVALLNIWATWCYACNLEHPMLMKIHTQYHVPIYSIVYKDDAESARQYLAENGDPYTMTGLDANGDAAIDFGIYGTPETFVISPQGKIIYRHIGAINQKIWETLLLPMIQQYEAH